MPFADLDDAFFNKVKIGVATLGALSAATYYWLKGRKSSAPDYSAATSWYVREAQGDKPADVFYAHPTTMIGLARWNMAWENMQVCTGNVAGDPDLCKGQAGAWRGECNLWAPKYRQMGMLSQMQDLESASEGKLRQVKQSFDLALGDVKNAFVSFLAMRPDKKRPFVVAGHSQGSVLMSKVLADCVEGTEHEQQFVAAYLCGGYVPADLFSAGPGAGPTVFRSLHPCTGPDDLRCIISYDTRTTAFKPESINKIGMGMGVWPHHMYWLLHDRYCERPQGTDDVSKPRIQISPQTWTAAPGGKHLGVNTSFKTKPPNGAGNSEPFLPPADYAGCIKVTEKAVVVQDPDAWLKGAGKAGGPGNMHPIDVHFWFFNIQDNVKRRIQVWRDQTHE